MTTPAAIEATKEVIFNLAWAFFSAENSSDLAPLDYYLFR